MTGLFMELLSESGRRDEPFHFWHDQHVAKRLTVPGVESAQQYVAMTGDPRLMSFYDLASPEVVDSAEFVALDKADQAVVDNLPSPVDRRVYSAGEVFVNDSYSPEKATHVVGVWMTVNDPEDFANWYQDEHVPGLFQMKDWMRTRRYELISGSGPKYLALHDLSSLTALDDPAGAPARDTPWRDRVIAYRTAYERRVWILSKRY